MAENNRAVGNAGEDAVCEYLKNKGCVIVRRNYYSPYGEIDIVAEKDGCTSFVEVKTRASSKFARPCQAVNHTKQQHMINTALSYIQKYSPTTMFRFDVAEVIYKKTGNKYEITDINYIESAFTL